MTDKQPTLTAAELAAIGKRARGLRVTLEQVLSWNPCYTKEQIEKLAGKRKTITAGQILRMPIPDKDKLWAAMREELIPAKLLHRFACDCAWQALMAERKAGREPDRRSWDAVKTKRRWLAGKCSDQDLSAAWSAAWSAADSAAESAAAWSAVWSAAESAAGSAARSAAWSAADSAAESAAAESAESAAGSAWSAAESNQVAMLIKLLSK